jgi:hypothetical protein
MFGVPKAYVSFPAGSSSGGLIFIVTQIFLPYGADGDSTCSVLDGMSYDDLLRQLGQPLAGQPLEFYTYFNDNEFDCSDRFFANMKLLINFMFAIDEDLVVNGLGFDFAAQSNLQASVADLFGVPEADVSVLGQGVAFGEFGSSMSVTTQILLSNGAVADSTCSVLDGKSYDDLSRQLGQPLAGQPLQSYTYFEDNGFGCLDRVFAMSIDGGLGLV